MVRVLLDILYFLFILVLTPWILYRMMTQNRYRSGWGQRFGFVPYRNDEERKPCIWLHAVSMGEVNAMGTLINQLKKTMPENEIIISSTTDTGIDRAKKLYSQDHLVFFYPLDFSWAIKKAMHRLRPSLCIMMELEIWPNFTSICHQKKIPLIVANGRISSGKGFPRYKKVAALVRPIFRKLSLVLVQDQEYADRFTYLGVPTERVQVVGSLKYDTAEVGDTVAGADELAAKLLLESTDRIFVAGSTGPGEEEMILDAYKQLVENKKLKKLRLVIVPRKPERFDEVAELIKAKQLPVVRYSKVKADQFTVNQDDAAAVILGDTMGDLRKFYSLASVIFVGRSLVPMGGSDMMEAAGLAKPVIVGPYTENFTETVQKLMAAEGMDIVCDTQQLKSSVEQLLIDEKKAKTMATNGRQVILDNQGATVRTVDAIASIVNAVK